MKPARSANDQPRRSSSCAITNVVLCNVLAEALIAQASSKMSINNLLSQPSALLRIIKPR